MVWRITQRAKGAVEGLRTYLRLDPNSTDTVLSRLEAWAKRSPNAPFLSFEGAHWTVGRFNAEVNRYAHTYEKIGVSHGEVIAVVMPNVPATLFHVWGLAKIGAVAALINPELPPDAILRGMQACSAHMLIATQDVVKELLNSKKDLPPYYHDGEASERSSDNAWANRLLGAAQTDPKPKRKPRINDVMAFIFTSGTTGYPKPAYVKHRRFFRAGSVFGAALGLTASDCIYNCLPLFHANGLVVATSMAVMHRCRLTLARRFSRTNFWSDCRKYDVTVFVYIGELCRYLASAPPSSSDTDHRVNRILGNGLQTEVFDTMQTRFGIKKILEFYGATEGNAETLNVFNTPGSCGVLIPTRMALVRCDPETGDLIRNAKGRCTRVKPGEPGLLLGAITATNEFAGYADRAASEAKVVRGVFRKNDKWFNTGDLLKRDRLYRLYFVDRLGDTFRWKGENVSTTEVADILRCAPGVTEAVVYGVKAKGADGRVGMAALVVGPAFDPRTLFSHTSHHLASFARPRYIRLITGVRKTATHKIQKAKLRQEGVSRAVASDPLFIRDEDTQTYQPFEPSQDAPLPRQS